MKRKLVLSLSMFATVFAPAITVVSCSLEDVKAGSENEDLIDEIKTLINEYFYGREASEGKPELPPTYTQGESFPSSKTEAAMDSAIEALANESKDLTNIVSTLGLNSSLGIGAVDTKGVLVEWKVKSKTNSHSYDTANAKGAKYAMEIRLSKGTAKNVFINFEVSSTDYVPYVETRESNYMDVNTVSRHINNYMNDVKYSNVLASVIEANTSRWLSFNDTISLLDVNYDEIFSEGSPFRFRDTRVSFWINDVGSINTATGLSNKVFSMKYKVEKGNEQTYAFYESVSSEEKSLHSKVVYSDALEQELARIKSSVLLNGTDYNSKLINIDEILPSSFVGSKTSLTLEEAGVSVGNRIDTSLTYSIKDLVPQNLTGSIEAKLEVSNGTVSRETDIVLKGLKSLNDQVESARHAFANLVNNDDLRSSKTTLTSAPSDETLHEWLGVNILGFNNLFVSEYLTISANDVISTSFSAAIEDDKLTSTGAKYKIIATFEFQSIVKTVEFYVVSSDHTYKNDGELRSKRNLAVSRFAKGYREISNNYLPSEIKKNASNELDKSMLFEKVEEFDFMALNHSNSSDKFGTLRTKISVKVGDETTYLFATLKNLRTNKQVDVNTTKEVIALANNISSTNQSNVIYITNAGLSSINQPKEFDSNAAINNIKNEILTQFVYPITSDIEVSVIWEDWNVEKGLSIRIRIAKKGHVASSRAFYVRG